MRNIPDNNLGIPVLITINDGSSGSGFLLTTNTNVFLITAKHVLFNAENNLRGQNAVLVCPTSDINDNTTTDLRIDLNQLNISNNVRFHANKDIASINLGTIVPHVDRDGYRITYFPGINYIHEGNSPIVFVNAQNSVKLIADVLISNDVFLYGYPSSLGLRESPQFDYTKPLLRKGIIANVYIPQGTIILDCPVYYGNSGGAIVEVDHNGIQNSHKIIGVIIEFVPYIENWKNQSNGIIHTDMFNSGYSVAVAMDYVFELIGFIQAPLIPIIPAI
jgi:hypothetical protein